MYENVQKQNAVVILKIMSEHKYLTTNSKNSTSNNVY